MQNQLSPHGSFLTRCVAVFLLVIVSASSYAQVPSAKTAPPDLTKLFKSPPEAASPWVFWYWLNGAISREGISADLQAMKAAGIAGAYLMPIKDTANPVRMRPAVRQLTPEWWVMVNHAMKEAKRFNLKIAMHVSDGFALAGGPWITPELSMQKVVWTKTRVKGDTILSQTLQQPETLENYYNDIAVFAYPSPISSSSVSRPVVTSSKPDSTVKLLAEANNTKTFTCDDQCWIQYEYAEPFTCRSIRIEARNNYQVNRMIVEVSDDGQVFRSLGRLSPPRHGWQDWDADYTHAIPEVTAKFFRFRYDKSGSEPGAEDLDAAKWKPSFKLTGIALSGEPAVHQYEGKNGSVWRVSQRSTAEQVPDSVCVKRNTIVDLSAAMDKNGKLTWKVPPGDWTIIRMGHTSTGHTNATGGGGKGLECDKFNPAAIRLQFNNWYGEVFNKVPPELTSSVLKVFHVDSWECGSQNWSPVFAAEFRKRRGYDLRPYLPVMAGIPVESVDMSERFLYDVRQTIAELVADNFYVTLAALAHGKGVSFTAESVAPTMVSDGMLHYKNVDVPMGEYWLRSPTHDKPNDMLDAISGAHVYGKPVVQAEAFTELRMAWDEHPGMLKTLADRNYALGFNKLVYHVFMHNPWPDKKTALSLDEIGLYFQRDQVWWKQAKGWVDYARRCQALLQVGRPVTDIAVFTGDEWPRRAVLPDRLVPVLPGIFADRVQSEAERLANVGEPLRILPVGVTHSANMADPEKWIDPLKGYAYDSYNADALTRLSRVKNGRIELPGGASYAVLVLPGSTRMTPNGHLMSVEVAAKITELVKGGAKVIFNEQPLQSPGLYNARQNDAFVKRFGANAWKPALAKTLIKGPFGEATFSALGFQPDFLASEKGVRAPGIAWTHRAAPGADIYFISNQDSTDRQLDVSLRVSGRLPELFDAVTGTVREAKQWQMAKGRTLLPIRLAANGSVFVVLRQPVSSTARNTGTNWDKPVLLRELKDPWKVTFDPAFGGPSHPVMFDTLSDWSKHADTAIRYYSGTASYSAMFNWSSTAQKGQTWIDLGRLANIAEVFVNGVSCGVVWTPPYKADITKALKPGQNTLVIEVSNTWANRLIRDHNLPDSQRVTTRFSPFRLEGKPLLEAGLLGPVLINTTP